MVLFPALKVKFVAQIYLLFPNLVNSLKTA